MADTGISQNEGGSKTRLKYMTLCCVFMVVLLSQPEGAKTNLGILPKQLRDPRGVRLLPQDAKANIVLSNDHLNVQGVGLPEPEEGNTEFEGLKREEEGQAKFGYLPRQLRNPRGAGLVHPGQGQLKLGSLAETHNPRGMRTAEGGEQSQTQHPSELHAPHIRNPRGVQVPHAGVGEDVSAGVGVGEENNPQT